MPEFVDVPCMLLKDRPLPSHVEWLVGRLGADLERQGPGLDARSVLAVLCEADPTPKRLAVQWLAERLVEGGFLWEDVRAGAASKAHETLVAFGTHRHALKGPERNLAFHDTLFSAWRAVAHLVPKAVDGPGSQERRRQERTAAREESIVLCERPVLTVAVPLTEAASKWWGRGTRWCTAADNDNAFDEYNCDGPLIVVVLPEGKFQLHLGEGGNPQFMDASDGDVSRELLAERWDVLGPIVTWALERTSAMIRFVPESLLDREMCMAAVAQDPMLLEHVPERMRDKEMCRAAVEACPSALCHVPESLRDREMCISVVSRDSALLALVPQALLDHPMCMAAVSRGGMALQHVPDALRDHATCLAAVEQTALAFSHVPERHLDRSILHVAVARIPAHLSLVPRRFRDHDLCLLAVGKFGYAVQHVPKAILDRTIRVAAVSNAANSLRHIPEALRDRETCMAAVTRSGSALQHVPPSLRDTAMRAAAEASLERDAPVGCRLPAPCGIDMEQTFQTREETAPVTCHEDALLGLAEALAGGTAVVPGQRRP